MSLAQWKDDVEAAASGAVTVVEDLRVRQHLRTCDECRAHYDQLVFAGRVLSATKDALPSEHDAMFARLNAALDEKAKPVMVAKPSRSWWFIGAVAAAAVVALTFVTRPPPLEPEREITLRGGGDDVAPSLSFSVYAKAKTGDAPVRLVAQFPQSGEARATENEWLQVKAPHGAAVVAVRDAEVIVFEAGGSQGLRAGTWKLYVAMSSAEALKRAALGGAKSSGVIMVTP